MFTNFNDSKDMLNQLIFLGLKTDKEKAQFAYKIGYQAALDEIKENEDKARNHVSLIKQIQLANPELYTNSGLLE